MIIELLNTDDLEQVVAIENESFSKPWSTQYFLQELNKNDLSEIYVLKEGDEVIGYGDLWYMFENCDLTKICIKKEYRHQGYGNKLLKHLLRIAREKGCEFMHLEVDVMNNEAITLYKNNQFEVVRTRKNYYENGDDAYDMLKSLYVKPKQIILAIESSCDETACAIINEDLEVLSSVVTSQIDVHARFGGVIPEVASRMHVEQISTIV